MAVIGDATTYDLTAGVKLDIEDVIWLISPFDVPLLGTNGADGRTALSSDTCFEKKVEWLDELLLTPRSTIGSAATTGDAFIVLATGDQAKFQTGDVVLVNAEYMYVTGYGTTADSLTVTRGFNSSTAASAALNNVVVGVGAANQEGADVNNARSLDRTDRYNMTEIFGPVAVQVSGSENAVQKYGLTGTEFDHQVANRAKEQMIALEQALIYGTRSEDTGNRRRTMGGMFYYITTNVDTTTTSLTDTPLLVQLQAAFDAGGTPDRIVVGSRQKRNVSAINSSNIRYAQDTNVRGQAIDYYDSDFGRISVVLDRWMRSTDLIGFSRDQATVCTLRPLGFEMLAKTGDSEKGQVVMEKSLRFRREPWAFRFTALQ